MSAKMPPDHAIDMFSPIKLGGQMIGNRFAMAPMTRARTPNEVAGDLTALYYKQRASAGLIISEATAISEEARGYVFCPGIWSGEQVNGWRKSTAAVHDSGGTIFVQLWHVGRVSHFSLQRGAAPPVSSVTTAGGIACVLDASGRPKMVPASPPRALATKETARVADDFSRAALNAIEAGFDGVEIHSANGYLFDQFLNARLNTRCDRYGGRRVVDRTRFVIEVVDAVADAIGASRIGVRLSPGGTESDMPLCEKSEETLFYLASELSRRQIAYLHIVDQKPPSMRLIGEYSILRRLRRRFDGLIILAGNLDLETGNILVNEGLIDVVAIGRAFISNPDLVRRLAQGLPLAPIPESGIYGGGAEGYIDYPPYSP